MKIIFKFTALIFSLLLFSGCTGPTTGELGDSFLSYSLGFVVCSILLIPLFSLNVLRDKKYYITSVSLLIISIIISYVYTYQIGFIHRIGVLGMKNYALGQVLGAFLGVPYIIISSVISIIVLPKDKRWSIPLVVVGLHLIFSFILSLYP